MKHLRLNRLPRSTRRLLERLTSHGFQRARQERIRAARRWRAGLGCGLKVARGHHAHG